MQKMEKLKGIKRLEAYERLLGVRELIKLSCVRAYGDFWHPLNDTELVKKARETGYQPMNGSLIFDTIDELINSNEDLGDVSLDLFCGNGSFALRTAALGISSYGIDINPALIEEARKIHKIAVEKGYISPRTTCKFETGNVYPNKYLEGYKEASKRAHDKSTMPQGEHNDAYAKLGITPRDATLIYAFPWSDQTDFLSEFLQNETNVGTIYVLPHGHSRKLNCDTLFTRLRGIHTFKKKQEQKAKVGSL